MNAAVSIPLQESEFQSIRHLVFEYTGISLSDNKKELVKRRFTPRVKALGLSSFTSYVEHVKSNGSAEINHFCNAITTNLTSFFRENHHFEYLLSQGLPELMQQNIKSKKLRLWSAGCSSGQEAYCIAIIVNKILSASSGWDAKILATDLDENCLSTAREGVYTADRFDKMTNDLITDYFSQSKKQVNGFTTTVFEANDSLKKMITFNKLNLMSKWPMKGKFDVIFCRNVFIYFDKDTQSKILERFASLQSPGSHLCLGHSETIPDPENVGYKLIGKTLYTRI